MKRTLDWTPEQSKLVTDLLQKHLPGVKAWAYGSRARWNARPDSDLDLVVFADPSQKAQVSALREALEESSLPYKVDLFVWGEVPDNFRPQIEKEAVPVGVGHARPLQGQGEVSAPPLGGAGPRSPLSLSKGNAQQWEMTTLGKICRDQGGAIQTGPFGSQLHASDYVESGVPVVMPVNIGTDGRLHETGIERISTDDANRLSQHILNAGDIVFSRRGDVTRCAYVEGSQVGWFCGTGCLKIRFGNEKKATSRFVAYRLKLPESKEWLIRHAVGATMPNLNTSILGDIPVVLPPISVQKSIAHILGTLDDKIELNRRINQTLEEMAQALFKSWFVDFDPVRAKAAVYAAAADSANSDPTDPAITTVSTVGIGHARSLQRQKRQWQDCEQQAELAAMRVISGKTDDELVEFRRDQPDAYAELARTASLFPSRLTESDIGPIPEGWEVETLASLIEFNPRYSLKKGSLSSYLDMKNVPIQGHLADEVIQREFGSGTKFSNGDTLLARITPCLENGKTAFVDFLEDGEIGWGSTEFIVMRPKGNLPVSIGYLIARLDAFRSVAIQSMTGTSGRQRAEAGTLAMTKWLRYPDDLLHALDCMSGKYLELAKSNGQEMTALAALRDSLLPKLLSGEMEIPDELLVDAVA